MLAEMREAIEEGFRQAEQMMGGLPDVLNDTHDLVMEKKVALEEELSGVKTTRKVNI